MWLPTQAEGLRFVIADARGDGRPDFAYQARVLYADTIQPADTSLSGGQITISGMGFRAGNQVLVNGVPAVGIQLDGDGDRRGCAAGECVCGESKQGRWMSQSSIYPREGRR